MGTETQDKVVEEVEEGAPAAEETSGSEVNVKEQITGLLDESAVEGSEAKAPETTTTAAAAPAAAAVVEDKSKKADETPAAPAAVKDDTAPTKTPEQLAAEAEAKKKADEEAAKAAAASSAPAGKTKEEIEAEVATSIAATQQMIEDAEKRRGEIIDVLAEKYYAPRLTDELVEELHHGDPRKVLPKLLAGLYVDAVQGITGMLLQNLPHMVGNVIEGRNYAKEAQDAFFGQFPALAEVAKSDPTIYSEIDRVAKTYVALNPNSPLEQRIRDVGLTVSIARRISPPGAPATTVADSDLPPHQPAGSGAPGGPGGERAPNENPITRLYEETLGD